MREIPVMNAIRYSDLYLLILHLFHAYEPIVQNIFPEIQVPSWHAIALSEFASGNSMPSR